MTDTLLQRLTALTLLLIIGVIAYIVGSRWSEDAIALLVGVFFGWMGGIPTALLIVARDRMNHQPHTPVAEYSVVSSGETRVALPTQNDTAPERAKVLVPRTRSGAGEAR